MNPAQTQVIGAIVVSVLIVAAFIVALILTYLSYDADAMNILAGIIGGAFGAGVVGYRLGRPPP